MQQNSQVDTPGITKQPSLTVEPGITKQPSLTVDEIWRNVVNTVDTDIKSKETIFEDIYSASSDSADDFNIWNVSTLPERIHENIWQDITNLEILSSVFCFMFWMFVLLSLWHLSLWEKGETGLCNVYSFIFIYRGCYMLVALLALWSYLRYMVAMQGTMLTICQGLLGYIINVALDAGSWYYIDNQKPPGSNLRWLLSINLVLSLSPLLIGHTVHHARIFRRDCFTPSKECPHDSFNAGVLKLIVIYPKEIFKDPSDRTILKGLGSAEKSLVKTGFAILLITTIFVTFIFCNFFYNFYTTLSDSQEELKNALVLGYTVIMSPWGWLLRRVGSVNDALEFKPEVNEPKVWERHLSRQAFINSFNSKRMSQAHVISMCDISFFLTERKWFHRLPTCIQSCFFGSTLEETSNKILVEHFAKIMDNFSTASFHHETPTGISQAPEQQADGRGTTAESPLEAKCADVQNVPEPKGVNVEMADVGDIKNIYKPDEKEDGSDLLFAPLRGKTDGNTVKTDEEEMEGSIKGSSDSDSFLSRRRIWSSTCRLVKTLSPGELIDRLKDDLLHHGGYDKNLGSKTTQFYYGMFYRTLYYSLFGKINDMRVIVGFEVINFLSSFVLCFLRMSHMYFQQSTKLTDWLASKGAPVVIHNQDWDEWNAELSVCWILNRFAEVLCLSDFVITTTVLRYRYPNNDFIPVQDMGGNAEGYITDERYMIVMRYVLVILGFQVFHIVSMLLLFKHFYNLKLRAYFHFLSKSKHFRFIIFFGGLHVLQDMYILRHKLELSKF